MDSKALTTKYATAENVRPETLANDLGISGKIVRGFLRQTFTRPIEAKGTTWVLNAEQASATVAHFVARRPAETKPVAPAMGAGAVAPTANAKGKGK